MLHRRRCLSLFGPVVAVVLGLSTAAVPSGVAVADTTPPPAPAAALPPGGSFVPVVPTRVEDTRAPGAPPVTSAEVDPDAVLPADVEGTVAEVLVNVTVVDAVGPGYVVVGEDHGTSNGNYVAGAPSATLALVPLHHRDPRTPPTFSVTLSTPAQVVVDVQGYVTTPQAATSSSFTSLPAATRVADSRLDHGLHPFGADETQTLDVRSAAHLPTDATAVIANLTVASATAGTFVTGAGAGGGRPAVSSVNAAPGDVVANRALLPLGADGRIALYNLAGRTDLVVDVVGYLAPDPAGSWFEPATPIRVLDVSGRSAGIQATVVGGDSALGNTPSVHDLSPTTAVWLTVVGDRPAGPGYVTAGPGGAPPSGTSDLDAVPHRAVANAGPVRVAPGDGTVSLTASVPTRLVADLSGWFRRTPTTATAGVWTSATPDAAPVGEWTLPSSLPPAFGRAVYTADRTESGARAYVVTPGGGVERAVALQSGPPGRPVAFSAPAPVDDLVGVTALASAPDATPTPAVYALQGSGEVLAFGSDASGQLGRAPSQVVTDPDDASPVPLPGPATAVFATPAVGFALLADGTVDSWGATVDGNLGRPATATPWVPGPVAFPSGPPVQVVGDASLSFALDAAGHTLAWGSAFAAEPTPFTRGCPATMSLFGDLGGVWALCSDGSVRHLTDASGTMVGGSTPPVAGVTALGPSGDSAVRVLLADGRVADADYTDYSVRYEAGFADVTTLSGTRQLQVTLVGS